jgi:2-amino-4-hydroxy-6-hydroxymethyldihydropteridine diphosphokinase
MDNSASAFVAMGTNLPFEGVSGPALLARAVAALGSAGLAPRALSGVWETAAWPSSDQPDYYNAAVELDPRGLSPQPLYEILRSVEASFGRNRREQWAPRTLDLDLIAVGALAGRYGGVVLPHPRMHERAFVLAPLAEIAPHWRHPELGRTTQELFAGLQGNYRYRRMGDFPPAGAGDGDPPLRIAKNRDAH